MKTIAGLPFLALALVLCFPAPCAGQEQASEPPASSSPLKEITGTITSVAEECSSFVLVQEVDGKKIEITFVPSLLLPLWTRGPEGCSTLARSGDRLILKPGARVIVVCDAQDNTNRVTSVSVDVEKPSPPSNARPADKFVPSPPKCVYCPGPKYTKEARNARLEGAVLMEITILPDGSTTYVRVTRGLGKGLDESAVETVRKWRFKPIIGPDNKPVTVDLSVEVNFHLTID